uniref:Uncharacterized protein n=1 Tax=Cacopsylla melanoneura TaxID=428564 RepID=A0A8D8TG90_9HEMI
MWVFFLSLPAVQILKVEISRWRVLFINVGFFFFLFTSSPLLYISQHSPLERSGEMHETRAPPMTHVLEAVYPIPPTSNFENIGIHLITHFKFVSHIFVNISTRKWGRHVNQI